MMLFNFGGLKMEPKAKYGIAITTYEVDQETGEKDPILTHVFWGKTLEDALGYAKSHTITDFFFASSFDGEMPWGKDVLLLKNTYRLIGASNRTNQVDQIIDQLDDEAKINLAKEKQFGILEVMSQMTEK
jgi:hypothetical protein